jgi:hypothetical protein
MKTRVLMMGSSLAMGLAGLVASFAPAELLGALHVTTADPLPVLIQLLGALYVAFALANWTAKDSLIGGIYARPLALGNFVHFVVAALALGKFEFRTGFQGPLVAVFVVYTIFALAFGWLVFGRGAACQVNSPGS